MSKGLTFCPIPRSKTFPATRPRLEAYPHLITRGTYVARLLIATEHNWIFTVSNNIKITKSLSSSADQYILVFTRCCPGHVKTWVKMNVNPVPCVHTDPPYAGLKWTVVFWIARWFYCARLSCRLINSTLAFSCVEQTITITKWKPLFNDEVTNWSYHHYFEKTPGERGVIAHSALWTPYLMVAQWCAIAYDSKTLIALQKSGR